MEIINLAAFELFCYSVFLNVGKYYIWFSVICKLLMMQAEWKQFHSACLWSNAPTIYNHFLGNDLRLRIWKKVLILWGLFEKGTSIINV